MTDLKHYIANVPDFPRPGILFRDIAPLLRSHFAETITAMSDLLPSSHWSQIDVIAGIESRGFILAAALAARHNKGFVLVRKQGKLPPPVLSRAYDLEYGAGVLEVQPGQGRLVLIDDVLATGGTLKAAAHLCREAGYQISALLVLIDLNFVPNFLWEELRVAAAIRY